MIWKGLRPLGPWRFWTFTEYVYEGHRIVAHIPRKHWGRNYEFDQMRWGPVLLDEDRLFA